MSAFTAEKEATMQSGKPHHHKETHGLRDDIDETTPLDDVRAPNVFERAKEEIEAIVQAINPTKQSSTHDTREDGRNGRPEQKPNDNFGGSHVKTPKLVEKAKETIKKMADAMAMHHEKDSPQHRHHKETHGRSDDIDESTPVDEVKAPGVFERAKEEIEAVFQAIHPKKDR